MSKELQCPHQIGVAGLFRGCMLGYDPDTCKTCTHPDKHYVEGKSRWCSYDSETGEYKEGGEK